MATESEYCEIAVRIKDIFDSKREEDSMRLALEPDGWQFVKIEDTSGGQRHIIFKRLKREK
jgi:hypothetical protein